MFGPSSVAGSNYTIRGGQVQIVALRQSALADDLPDAVRLGYNSQDESPVAER
jgi:hypothetical protein